MLTCAPLSVLLSSIDNGKSANKIARLRAIVVKSSFDMENIIIDHDWRHNKPPKEAWFVHGNERFGECCVTKCDVDLSSFLPNIDTKVLNRSHTASIGVRRIITQLNRILKPKYWEDGT